MKIALTLLTLVALPLVIVGYSVLIEPHWIETASITVSVSDLPREFDGLRIVQVSDLHLGPDVPREDLDRAIDKANQLDPDIVVITGDTVTKSADYIYPCSQSLQALRPKLGSYAVLGNHDFATDPDKITDALTAAGIKVLRNENDSIDKDSEQLWILGVDDIYLFQDDLPEAMEGIPSDATTILLCHSPDIANQASDLAVDLVLTGHTHGGQVRLPFIGPLIVPVENSEYVAGLYSVGDTQMYVNRGIGIVYLPVRFLARPEVTLLVLRAV